MAAVRVLTLALASLIAFLMLVGSSDAVTCYQCLSGSGCGDPFKPDGVENCTDSEGYCMKMKTTGTGASDGVRRGCSPAVEVNVGCQSQSAAGASVTICYCSGDFCNSAPGLLQHAGMYAVLATSAAVVRLAKLHG